jgi:signal transduction histidine kinase
VPPATRGEAANWLIIVMASQLIVPAWFMPVALSVPLALAAPAAYWAGVAGYPGTGAGVNSPAAAGSLLIVAAAVHWCGRRMLYGLASRADAGLARADRDAREQYVILARNIERREHERLLHDTVLNTLTALSRAGPADRAEVVRRCRHDVAMMEQALSAPADGQSGPPHSSLLSGLEAVVTEMRLRGLDVHVEVTGAVAAPDLAVTAIVHAAREALANVAAHAGTGEAWVTVSPVTDGTVAAPAGLEVTVRDAGAGFDPARVGAARLGVRRSITERIADCGGRASVCSSPGAGTVVTLCWPAPPGPGPAVLVGGMDHDGGRP